MHETANQTNSNGASDDESTNTNECTIYKSDSPLDTLYSRHIPPIHIVYISILMNLLLDLL